MATANDTKITSNGPLSGKEAIDALKKKAYRKPQQEQTSTNGVKDVPATKKPEQPKYITRHEAKQQLEAEEDARKAKKAKSKPKQAKQAATGETTQPTNSKEDTKMTTKTNSSNLISLSDICSQLKIEPKAARRKLRKAGVESASEERWEFNPKQAATVRNLLKGGKAK